ncbi:hypothetical protein CQ050_08340 [Achromobacter sp. MYb9]|uniref:hypothetical protein n=1 Tax=Achromobacter sp. MYb9 TaxID=1827284 RepID=UPI000CFD21F5|nr:hypothetical protein [Achromobacter sp. MYb9]PQZ69825.1 hypothetical protein CQ050_08340 [Achromobacter sp. MYb9]
MSITYRPPFDEDDERDLRALYRKPRPGTSPELDAAVRRTWHPGHSWHPGWAAAACAAMVAGLFAWTDMRENADMQEMNAQLAAPHEVSASAERSPASAVSAETLVGMQAAPVAAQRVSAAPNDTPAPQPQAAPVAPETAAAESAQQGEATATEIVAFSEQDVEARVAHIRALVQDDRQDEAVQALRELQQGAPDLTLPDDLQELAQQNPA